mmetsp:Transcript_6652/g.20224  ORF Transcript_6652/g.20224 Transcript_6652/m.20224 type:complete len:299 (+) Transcript_6652:1084-1980(+)
MTSVARAGGLSLTALATILTMLAMSAGEVTTVTGTPKWLLATFWKRLQMRGSSSTTSHLKSETDKAAALSEAATSAASSRGAGGGRNVMPTATVTEKTSSTTSMSMAVWSSEATCLSVSRPSLRDGVRAALTPTELEMTKPAGEKATRAEPVPCLKTLEAQSWRMRTWRTMGERGRPAPSLKRSRAVGSQPSMATSVWRNSCVTNVAAETGSMGGRSSKNLRRMAISCPTRSKASFSSESLPSWQRRCISRSLFPRRWSAVSRCSEMIFAMIDPYVRIDSVMSRVSPVSMHVAFPVES